MIYNEELVTAILENFEGGVSIISIDKKFIAFNNFFAQVYKLLTGEDLKAGRSIYYESLPDNIRSHREEKIDQALKGERVDYEGGYIVDGNYRFYATTLKPIFKDQQVVFIISYSTDITEKKEAEARILKSQEMYYSLFEQASDPIMVTDFTGSFLDVNAGLCKLFGYTKEELLKLKASDLIDVKDLERRPMHFETLASGKQVFTNRSMVHKNGTIIEVEANLKKFAEDRIMGIVRDVTELRKAKIQGELSEAKFRGAFENSAVGMALVGFDGKCIEVNKELCNMLGYSGQEEFLSLSYKDLTHPDDLDNSYKFFKDSIEGKGDTFRLEKRYFHKNGEVIWVCLNVSLIRDGNGNPHYFVASIENITGRKKAEIHQEKITGDLIRQNKDLEQFAYIVSHNLRAPVANIIGLSKLLSDERNDSEVQKQCVVELESSVKRLDNVINDLSRILQVKRDITEKKEEVYFSDLVENIKSSIKNLIVKENVQIETNFTSVDKITTLKSYLYSIFYNLILNSIKYRHPDRVPMIKIRSEGYDNKIRLSFSDNGMGIDLTRFRDQIFGLYKRFHMQVEGKGMGLFVVKTQVETLGGKIDVNSEPGKGIEFIIEF